MLEKDTSMVGKQDIKSVLFILFSHFQLNVSGSILVCLLFLWLFFFLTVHFLFLPIQLSQVEGIIYVLMSIFNLLNILLLGPIVSNF